MLNFSFHLQGAYVYSVPVGVVVIGSLMPQLCDNKDTLNLKIHRQFTERLVNAFLAVVGCPGRIWVGLGRKEVPA